MRKYISFFLLFIILIIPGAAKADTKSYHIDKLVDNAVIADNGDVYVEEEISYSFVGDYNGVYRNLLKRGSTGITISEVLVRDKNNKVAPMKKSDSSSDNTYQITDTESETKIKLFSKSSNEIKTFIFRYTIHGAAVKTNDSSELYWSFYKVENGVQVGDFELNLSLKSAEFDPSRTKHWAYIDGRDLKDSYDVKKIHMSGKDLTGVLGVRVLFQQDYLKIPMVNMDNSVNLTDQFDSYLINRNVRNMQGSGTNVVVVVVFIMILLIVPIAILITVLKGQKKYQEAICAYRAQSLPFNGSILSDPPSDLTPALVELLIKEKHISASSVCATLYYLSSKGYYSMEKKNYVKSKLFSSEEVEDLLFRRNFEKMMPESPHLQYFIDWMSQYEKEGIFTLRYVEEEVGTSRGAMEFRNMLSSFEDIVREEAERLGFYITILNKQVLSNKYYDERLRWLAYKNYLLEFIKNNQELKPVSSVDETLIYASVLGIETESLEELLERLKDQGYDMNNPNNYAMYSYLPFFITNYYLWNGINDNIYHDNSNFSSSDNSTGGDGGGFGGFSDGGGFSGGGGGDSGAF